MLYASLASLVVTVSMFCLAHYQVHAYSYSVKHTMDTENLREGTCPVVGDSADGDLAKKGVCWGEGTSSNLAHLCRLSANQLWHSA